MVSGQRSVVRVRNGLVLAADEAVDKAAHYNYVPL